MLRVLRLWQTVIRWLHFRWNGTKPMSERSNKLARDSRFLKIQSSSTAARRSGCGTLARDLGSARAVNLGFGGSTLEACVWFFERLVAPTAPASLLVYAGDNDLGDGQTPRQVRSRFEALAAKVNATWRRFPLDYRHQAQPCPARVAREDRGRQRDDSQDVARHPRAFYVDVFTPMLGPNGRPRPELFLDDGLHLSAAGYGLWATILKQHRHQYLPRLHRERTRRISFGGDGP